MRGFNEIIRLMNQQDAMFQVFSYENWNDELENDFLKLIECKIEDIVFSILVREKEPLTAKNIPMYSNFQDCTINICLLLECINNRGITMLELGKLFREYDAKDGAYYKYGESHAKTAELFGLVKIQNNENHMEVYLSNAGYFFYKHPEFRKKMLTRLILRTALVQNILKNYYFENYCVCDCFECLSYSTRVRRMPNAKRILECLAQTDEFDFDIIFNKLSFTCREN